MISASVLREELEYVPETGEARWRKGKPGRIKEKPVGTVASNGYFDTDKEAHAAYCRAASVAHGAFFNNGVS